MNIKILKYKIKPLRFARVRFKTPHKYYVNNTTYIN